MKKGSFKACHKTIKDFEDKWKKDLADDATIRGKVDDLRRKMQAKSTDYVTKRLKEADRLRNEGKKEDGVKLLQEILLGMEGFPDAEARLKEGIAELTK
jgi:hypothetical protein